MNAIKLVAGYSGGIICIVALAVYLRAILAGKVSSNKVTWGVWILVTLMLCVSYYQSASSISAIWVSVAYAISTIMIFIVLMYRSVKGEWTWTDKVCLASVVPVLVLWWAFHSAVLGLTLTMVIDVIGFIPLAVTVYKIPKSEYAPAWWLGFASNVVNLIAVEQWDWANAAYPVYMVLMTLTVAVLTQFPRLLRSEKCEVASVEPDRQCVA